MTGNKKQNSSGFTIVEMAIIVVILGLIVAGLTFSSSLLESARSQKYVSELSTMQTSLRTFRMKYDNYFPGDFKNAYDYWGSDCAVSASDCNGDGDDLIEADELAITHLKLAEMVKTNTSTFSGATDVALESAIDSNLVWRITTSPARTFYLDGNSTSFMIFERKDDTGAFLPKILKQIDEKIDDGNPADGSLFGVRGSGQSGLCANPEFLSNTNQSIYRYAVEVPGCEAWFKVEIEKY